MRKRYLIIIAVLVVSTFSIIFYLSLPTTFPNVFNEPQGNESEGDKGFLGLPFRLPWQTTTQTTSNKSSGGGGGGGGGTGGGAGAGSAESPEYIPKNYASIDSIPEGLKIFVSYYNNGIKSSLTSYAPFNLETDPNSRVCMLLASMIGNNTLKWTVDGYDCQFSVCEEFSYNRTETLYSDYGCLINMNEDHSVTLHFIPA
jgi:hypothetical protein